MPSREVTVRRMPPGYGVWKGMRYQEQSFDTAVRRGEVLELWRRETAPGRVSIGYRRLRDPRPWWVGPAKVAAVTVPGLIFAGVVLHVVARALWQVLPLLAGAATVGLLGIFLLTRGRGGGGSPHGGHGFHWSKC